MSHKVSVFSTPPVFVVRCTGPLWQNRGCSPADALFQDLRKASGRRVRGLGGWTDQTDGESAGNGAVWRGGRPGHSVGLQDCERRLLQGGLPLPPHPLPASCLHDTRGGVFYVRVFSKYESCICIFGNVKRVSELIGLMGFCAGFLQHVQRLLHFVHSFIYPQLRSPHPLCSHRRVHTQTYTRTRPPPRSLLPLCVSPRSGRCSVCFICACARALTHISICLHTENFEMVGAESTKRGSEVAQILLHPKWGSAVYPASLFTKAPLDSLLAAIRQAEQELQNMESS